MNDYNSDPNDDSLGMHGDIEYDNGNWAKCPQCNYNGKLGDFVEENPA